MSKTRELLKNIGFLSISSLGVKVISFLMIPLYTSVLTTEEYGQYDFFNTTVSLLIPFFTLNISESTIIYTLSSKYQKAHVLSISLKYAKRSIVWFFLALLLNQLLGVSPEISEYNLLIMLMFI